jgi:hypothetical protein
VVPDAAGHLDFAHGRYYDGARGRDNRKRALANLAERAGIAAAPPF